jgi:hypothetical protein
MILWFIKATDNHKRRTASMQKTRIEHDSSLDALIAVSIAENQFNMSSEEFYDKFSKGLMNDTIESTEWANNYRHYQSLYKKVEKQLRNVA